MQVLIDGTYYDKEHAKISVFDHGLLYGDGIFEGIRIYNGRVFELEDHIERLYMSAQAIALEVPIDRVAMFEATLETVRRNELRDGYIRLVVTRGEGDLGLNPVKCPKSSYFIITSTIQLYPPEAYEKGLTVITCSTRRNSPQCINGSVKSLNYLTNILGALELRGTGANEGIVLNQDGWVAECTADNLFFVKGGKVFTPHPITGALRGISRGVVIKLCREQLSIPVEEGLYTLYDIYNADELFLTGTGAEAAPIVEADRRKIGDGTPGPVTRRIIKAFRDYAATSGAPVWPE
ncbi:MAG: branched-chain-amino-acid transaminase [Gaiellales bacterium]|nr:branched-chain-amino-acid transaminase [Gaiellales bacterium]